MEENGNRLFTDRAAAGIKMGTLPTIDNLIAGS
jgi:hypothetical protein